jgi:hypothetical protein
LAFTSSCSRTSSSFVGVVRLSPISHSSIPRDSTLNQGPFPPRSLPASQVLRAPPTPVLATPSRRVRSSPRMHRPPVLRTPPCAHMPRPLPRWATRLGRLLPPSASAFPAFGTGRHPRSPLGACSGFTRVAACVLARPPFKGLLLRGFGSGSRPPSPPDGFRGASTIPRAGLPPAGDSAPLHGAPKSGRVAPGDCSPGAPTDPDVRDYRIRLFGSWICHESAATPTRALAGFEPACYPPKSC